jgi:hypothetical protein
VQDTAPRLPSGAQPLQQVDVGPAAPTLEQRPHRRVVVQEGTADPRRLARVEELPLGVGHGGQPAGRKAEPADAAQPLVERTGLGPRGDQAADGPR